MAVRFLTRNAKEMDKTQTDEKPAETEDNDEDIVVKKKRADYLLAEFFDDQLNWGKRELTSSRRPGRPWSEEELRLKSNSDLHKLWYVLLKERNMLLTMEHAHKIRHIQMPSPERLDRIKESMENVEAVVHERNDAFLRLETGDSASPPERTITSFAGFTYQKSAAEHYQPFEVSGHKEYEVPMLDEQQYIMQKLWNEKEHIKKQNELDDEYLLKDPERHTNSALIRVKRRFFDRLEDLPANVVARRREEQANIKPPKEPL